MANILRKNDRMVSVLKKTPDSWDVPPKGKPTGKCAACGKEFNQDYVGEQNRYTSYKRCHYCRKKAVAENRPVEMAQLNYTPFAAQQIFHESKARFRILACGNRFGKDFCSIMEGIRIFAELLNENRYISHPELTPAVYWWIIAPTEKLAKQNWADLKKYFPREWVVDLSNSNFTMLTIGDGIIEVRSGYDPESLVGVGLDLVTITEAARIADLKKAWSNLRARLDSRGRGLAREKPPDAKFGWGKAIINSSPLGKNDFYDLFMQGRKDSDTYMDLFESWQFSAWENPSMAEMRYLPIQTKYGPITYEESLVADMGRRQYDQNYMACFLEDASAVFKNFEENCVEYMPLDWDPAKRAEYVSQWRTPQPFHSYLLGYDPAAGGGDTPALLVRETETGKIMRIYDMGSKGWDEQWDWIAKVSAEYRRAPVAFSRTGHETVESGLTKRGLSVIVWDERGSGKTDMVINMETVVEGRRMRILHDGSPETATMIRQFKDYSAVRRGSAVTYGNNKEPHDDYVSAGYVVFFDGKKEEKRPPYVGVMCGI